MYDSSGSMIPDPPTVPPTSKSTRVNDTVERMGRELLQQDPEMVQVDITRIDDKLL